MTYITIEDARRIVDACGGTYTPEETESRFGEGYTAALDEADKALAKAAAAAEINAKGLKAKALAAAEIAPGQWERDTEKGEGEYGIGPDTHEGYLVPYVYDGRGKRLFDAHQTDVGEVHEEWDGDENGSYCTATDEASCTVLDFTVAACPLVVLQLIAQRDGLLEALQELVAVVRGECPSLLNEDSGGSHRLIEQIETALSKALGQDGSAS